MEGQYSRQSQVSIVAILLRSFCVYDKSFQIAVGFYPGYHRTFGHR